MRPTTTTAAGRPRRKATTDRATRIALSTVGFLAALAGIEHGIGEIRQGWVAPPSIVFESWPDTPAFDILSGEPAMTLVPNLAVSGGLAIVAALAVGVWATWFVARPHGGWVLIGLSVLLLVVGGGFGPPLIGMIGGVTALRLGSEGKRDPGRIYSGLAAVWLWLLGAAAVGYLSLVPGVVVLSALTGFEDAGLVAGLTVFSFTALVLALVAARVRDRLDAPEAGDVAKRGPDGSPSGLHQAGGRPAGVAHTGSPGGRTGTETSGRRKR